MAAAAVAVSASARIAHAAACAFAIFSSLVAYSFLQERIMTRPYYTTSGSRSAAGEVLRPAFFPGHINPSDVRSSSQADNLNTTNDAHVWTSNQKHATYTYLPPSRAYKKQMTHQLFDFFRRNKYLVRHRGNPREPPSVNSSTSASTVYKHLRSRDRATTSEMGPSYSPVLYDVYGEYNASAGDAFRFEDDIMDGALFQSSLFLVLANRVFAILLTLLVIALRRQFRADVMPKAPFPAYLVISLSNVIATSCQYEALKWLTFPTLTVGKCAKMLPVMLILNFRKGKRYSLSDFVVALSVVAGAAIMILTGNVSARRGQDGTVSFDSAHGFMLLAAYLLFDAITSTYQEHLFQRYSMSVYNQMLYINLSTSFLASIGLVLSGGLFDALAFLAVYPAAIQDIAALSVTAVAGQFAISHTIHAFGALIYAGIMTLRQFCSVLISNLAFEHGLTAWQWFGATVVFSSLFTRVVIRSLAEASIERRQTLSEQPAALSTSLLSVSSTTMPSFPVKLQYSPLQVSMSSISSVSNCS